ncbi:YibE/F family protein [Candidatus Peregrinibacteria bacterium]|nr:YibE/F family protein [Candidatus Peregrinibacteria bacterium]
MNKIRFANVVLLVGVLMYGFCFTVFAQAEDTAVAAEVDFSDVRAEAGAEVPTAATGTEAAANETEAEAETETEAVAPETETEPQGERESQLSPETAEILRARVLGVASEKETISPGGEKKLIRNFEFEVTAGSIKGEKIQIQIEPSSMISKPELKKGDELLIHFDKNPDGSNNFYILDYERTAALYWLFAIFVIITIVVGRWYGLSSIIGLVISFAIIFMIILPLIVQGYDPVGVSIMGSAIIIPATFYLSHGLNKKTSIAITGTIISLIITGILAVIFVGITRLTGLASEESGFVITEISSLINMKGLLLAGIIIGTLGVLDDITISQSAIVMELKKANAQMGLWEMYKSAMRVGRDHISSMVNTLVLVYTGAALPLLMLFINTSAEFTEVINYEILATEIIRTLVGSIGLILAVPITTIIAAMTVERQAKVIAKK